MGAPSQGQVRKSHITFGENDVQRTVRTTKKTRVGKGEKSDDA